MILKKFSAVKINKKYGVKIVKINNMAGVDNSNERITVFTFKHGSTLDVGLLAQP